MDISGEYRLSLSRQETWNALIDPDVLARCIPGCESLERLTEDQYQAKIKTALGPVKATFSTELKIVNANPPNSYRLEGKGNAGALGFGHGHADVTLTEENETTVLSYEADFQVGGRLAQLGSRLLVGATRKIANEFFGRLTKDIDQNAERVELKRPPPSKRRAWIIAIIIALIIIGDRIEVLFDALRAWWLGN